MNLNGDKVILRPIQTDDFRYIIKWSNDPEIKKYYDDDYPKTLAESKEWYKKIKSNRYQQKFMVVVDGEPIGDLELDHITWRSGDAELRIRIGEKHLWNNGYGTDAIQVGLKYAFGKLNLSRVYLRVYADNLRAIHSYEKAGFIKEGKLSRRTGDFREIILMRILKGEFTRSNNIIKGVS